VIYSLDVIVFNGSGGIMESRATSLVVLCAHAASLGHIDALGELGSACRMGIGNRWSAPHHPGLTWPRDRDARAWALHA
jgi:hypothetical protein